MRDRILGLIRLPLIQKLPCGSGSNDITFLNGWEEWRVQISNRNFFYWILLGDQKLLNHWVLNVQRQEEDGHLCSEELWEHPEEGWAPIPQNASAMSYTNKVIIVFQPPGVSRLYIYAPHSFPTFIIFTYLERSSNRTLHESIGKD